MKNITLVLAIALGFCATEAVAQTATRQRIGPLGRAREQRLMENIKSKMTPEECREYELWSTWPTVVDWSFPDSAKTCAQQYNVVFCVPVLETSLWTNGCGKCCIEGSGSCWKKIDANGRVVKVAPRTHFDEYIWLTNQAARLTIENRKKWAVEHGMRYEDAVEKQKTYFDALQARKEVALAAENAEREQNRAKVKREREDTQKKLAEMVEELRRQREAAAEKRAVEKKQ